MRNPKSGAVCRSSDRTRSSRSRKSICSRDSWASSRISSPSCSGSPPSCRSSPNISTPAKACGLGLAIVAVIVINAVFTFIQEYRAEKALEALKKLLPFNVKVSEDGNEIEAACRAEIVPGDVILLAEGDKVPADARLIETSRPQGEPCVAHRRIGAVVQKSEPFAGDLIESPNIAFAGTTVVSGSGKAAVFATGMKTEFGTDRASDRAP